MKVGAASASSLSLSSGTSLTPQPQGTPRPVPACSVPLITRLLKHKPKKPLKSLGGKELKVSTFSVMLLKLSRFGSQVAK